eukprot:1159500-Pelagomonas_calceolata.AAC.13
MVDVQQTWGAWAHSIDTDRMKIQKAQRLARKGILVVIGSGLAAVPARCAAGAKSLPTSMRTCNCCPSLSFYAAECAAGTESHKLMHMRMTSFAPFLVCITKCAAGVATLQQSSLQSMSAGARWVVLKRLGVSEAG